MKKQKKQRKHAGPGQATGKPDAGHLEETITSIATSTRHSLQAHWKPITAVIAVFGLIAMGYLFVQAVAEGRERRQSDRLYELTGSARARQADAVPVAADFRALLEDVRGAKAEKSVLKLTVQYLLERADSFADEAASDENVSEFDVSAILEGRSEGGDSTSEKPDPKKVHEDILQLIEHIVGEGRKRFPDDEEVTQWALNVEKTIDADRNRSWFPPSRLYELQPPKEPASDPDPVPHVGSSAEEGSSESAAAEAGPSTVTFLPPSETRPTSESESESESASEGGPPPGSEADDLEASDSDTEPSEKAPSASNAASSDSPDP